MSATSRQAGGMLAFIRKKFVGSYGFKRSGFAQVPLPSLETA